MTQHSLEQITRRWESSRIEYKCCRTHLSKDAWETVSSFANEGGGLILPHPFTPQVTSQDTQQVGGTPQVSQQVNELITQKADITDKRAMTLKFCESPKTLKEIMALLKMKDRNNFTEKILNPLLQGNYIQRTIPDKPRSRLQKYKTKAKS